MQQVTQFVDRVNQTFYGLISQASLKANENNVSSRDTVDPFPKYNDQFQYGDRRCIFGQVMVNPGTHLCQIVWWSRTDFQTIPSGFVRVVCGDALNISDLQNDDNNKTTMIWAQ